MGYFSVGIKHIWQILLRWQTKSHSIVWEYEENVANWNFNIPWKNVTHWPSNQSFRRKSSADKFSCRCLVKMWFCANLTKFLNPWQPSLSGLTPQTWVKNTINIGMIKAVLINCPHLRTQLKVCTSEKLNTLLLFWTN